MNFPAALVLALCFELLAPLRADELRPPLTQGQRVFTCGHSFHVFTYRQVGEIAKAAGLDQQPVGLSSIGGSMVMRHWEVPEEKNEAKAALIAGKVDVLTLSPIWLPDEGIENFAKLGVEHNPALRITVQEYWLPNDEYVPVYPLQTKKGCDHNATDLVELRKANARYMQDIEAHVREINQRLGKDALVVVPVGLASVALREKIAAGEAPGLKAQWDLFRDPWGHPQIPLQYLASYCHFAVIYRRSPVGLPVPAQFRVMKDVSPDDQQKLNRLLQELAWDAVSKHPLTGFQASAQTEKK